MQYDIQDGRQIGLGRTSGTVKQWLNMKLEFYVIIIRKDATVGEVLKAQTTTDRLY